MPLGKQNKAARRSALELHFRSSKNPFPHITIPRPPKAPPLPFGTEPPPWIETGDPLLPFDFSGYIRRLTQDIASRLEIFSHIDVSRILFDYTPARNRQIHGLQARVTPLRFPNGSLTKIHRGLNYQVQRFFFDDQEMFYIITFCLPRFLDRHFEDKLVTIFHELYHISPLFDGDIRRHEGRCSIHTSSQKEYDREMAQLAREYLSTNPDTKLYEFLRLNYAQLLHRHQTVVAYRFPKPKLIPIYPGSY